MSSGRRWSGVGLVTMLLSGWRALRQNDIKALLAYSTISHLGMIVMLLGLGSAHAVTAALFHVVNHSAFKAALFMVAGGIEKAAGTRDLTRLGGLWRTMPALSVTALAAIAATAGLPPLGGYVSKEMMLDAVVEVAAPDGWGVALAAAATAGALLSAAYAFALAWRGFLGAGAAPGELRAPRAGMTLPATMLAAVCLALGLVPQTLVGPLIEPATAAVMAEPVPEANLGLWHGFTPTLALGLAALAGGVALGAGQRSIASARRLLPDAAALFQWGFDGAVAGVRLIFHALHDRALHRYLAILIGAILLAGLTVGGPVLGQLAPAAALSRPPMPLATVGGALLVAGALGAAWFHEWRVSALVLTSVAGLMVALGYAWLSAPDLALTQVAVEIVTTLPILLAIRLLPRSTPLPHWHPRRLRDAGLGLGAGAPAGITALLVMTRPHEGGLARQVISTGRELTGTNLVHLVLVDFRAFDTLGEIVVLAIAALGVVALVRGFLDAQGGALPWRHMVHPEKAWDPYPLQFVVIARLLLPLAHLVAVYLFLRGESHPGGGFVAGLVLAMAVLTQYMAHGVAWTERRILLGYGTSVGCGVLVAAAVGLSAFLHGGPFLSHAHVTLHPPLIGELELGTALLFELGVLMTVAGATLLTMVSIGRIETRAPDME